MKFKSDRNNGDSHLAEINIVPLVDVMLVLLIIFMVTAPMLKEGIDINLPEVSANGIESNTDDFILSIDALGEIYMNENNKDKFALVSIGEQLTEAFKNREKKELYLKADKSIKYGYVMQVMAECQKAGIEKIGMITVAQDEDGDQALNEQ